MTDYFYLAFYLAGLFGLLYWLIKPLDQLTIKQIINILISQEWLAENFIILLGAIFWPAILPFVFFVIVPIILFPDFFFELFREFNGPGVHT